MLAALFVQLLYCLGSSLERTEAIPRQTVPHMPKSGHMTGVTLPSNEASIAITIARKANPATTFKNVAIYGSLFRVSASNAVNTVKRVDCRFGGSPCHRRATANAAGVISAMGVTVTLLA